MENFEIRQAPALYAHVGRHDAEPLGLDLALPPFAATSRMRGFRNP